MQELTYAIVRSRTRSLGLFVPSHTLRAALTSREVFESGLTTISFAFVGHHEYYDFDVLGLAPAELLEDGTLIEVFGVGSLSLYLNCMLTSLQSGLVGLVDNCDPAVGDTPHHTCLYARFDDLRAAAASKEMFESTGSLSASPSLTIMSTSIPLLVVLTPKLSPHRMARSNPSP